MRIGIFIRCYIDAFCPGLGIVTLELLGLKRTNCALS
jgi:hypothetical protein